MSFKQLIMEGFKEPQKEWKNKSVKINGKYTGICIDATIYGDQLIVILKKDNGEFEAFTFNKNNYDMKINVSDDVVKSFLKSCQSKIKNIKIIEKVKEFTESNNGGVNMIIKIDVIKRPYSAGDIIDKSNNMSKLKEFYKEVEDIVNNNKLGIKFNVGHYTTGDSCIIRPI